MNHELAGLTKKFSPSSSGVMRQKCDKCHEKEKTLNLAGSSESSLGKQNFGHDFTQIPPKSAASSSAQTEQIDMISLLSRAALDPAIPLEPGFKYGLEQLTGHNLSDVQIHRGFGSAKAAARLGAMAYTIGNNIHLGAKAGSLSQTDRIQLLAHETVHTIQQSGLPANIEDGVPVSDPNDSAELEADKIAKDVVSIGNSPSLALRNQLRSQLRTAGNVSRALVQRDLTGKYPTNGGDFELNLKTESHPSASSGMSGTIKFMANEKAPDSTNIRLLQVVRTEELTTGKDYSWTGGEANRNKMMTAAAPGVSPGYFVDHSAAAASPRTKKTDAPVSPFYRDYWPNVGHSQDGSKKGKAIKEASLWDYPQSPINMRFSFETLAKAADTGHVYGTVLWGFEISDASKGKVEKENAVGRNVTLLTTDKAIEKFNEFYRNPGASTAPK